MLSTQRVLAHRLNRFTSHRQWDADDPSAPDTIWGKATKMVVLHPGVRWVQAQTIDGLVREGIVIQDRVARNMLSHVARQFGEHAWQSIWYARNTCAIPLLEHPEWIALMVHKTGWPYREVDQVQDIVQRYFPSYFAYLRREQTLIQTPVKIEPQVGDQFILQRSNTFGARFVMPSGTRGVILSVDGENVSAVMEPFYEPNMSDSMGGPDEIRNHRIKIHVREFRKADSLTLIPL